MKCDISYRIYFILTKLYTIDAVGEFGINSIDLIIVSGSERGISGKNILVDFGFKGEFLSCHFGSNLKVSLAEISISLSQTSE